MAGKAIPLVDRFEKHFIPEPNSGCWLWLSATIVSRRGGPYGTVGNDVGLLPKQLLAHRASYTIYVGKISEGHDIDHACQNTLCVNPEHLEALTPV